MYSDNVSEDLYVFGKACLKLSPELVDFFSESMFQIVWHGVLWSRIFVFVGC